MTQSKRIIGLTGGIASGKSQVTNYLLDRGYHVIDADKVARKIVDPNQPGYHAVIKHFGSEILTSNQEIDRAKLGEIVFHDPACLRQLNALLHPIIFNEILREIQAAEERIVFVDIPLLFETEDEMAKIGLAFDEVWLVYVEDHIQLHRLIQRDQISADFALEKIASQMPLRDKKGLAHLVLDNNKDHDHLYRQIDDALMELKANED